MKQKLDGIDPFVSQSELQAIHANAKEDSMSQVRSRFTFSDLSGIIFFFLTVPCKAQTRKRSTKIELGTSAGPIH